ncbi:MAG: hypothetical protein BWX88_02756 [Planctomycetes bacterium ADurb.Bin126]|nr:MAG: hypothetical protein BWX88_02756 [Planctomycetes bacterium ADurb.Bin126]HOD79958.1 hypothetical protein [Phycisphaerae bacterium]HQL73227.1 hypothetical protein [Phycisphaerae bacterium]
MSDSSATANLGSGGVAFDGDLIGGEFIPFSKLVFGAIGTRTIVASDAGLPVHQQTGATWAVSLASLPALAAGTNAIGKLAANDGIDIGDVTVNNASAAGVYVRPGDGATFAISAASLPLPSGAAAEGTLGSVKTAVELIDNLVLAEDAAHQNADPGVQVLAVRSDTLSALAGTDGDYAPLQVNATGALYVAVSGTVSVSAHAVTNAGTFVVQENGAALTALQLIDDAIHAEDDAHVSGDKGALALAVRNDTPGALAGSDGDYIPLTTDSTGRLYTLAAQSGTWNVGTVTTVTTVTTVSAVTQITNSLPAGDNNIGNVDVVTLPALPAGDNNIGNVDVVTLPTGASAAQVQGTVAHDSAAANNPVLLGGKAVSSEPSAVANGDVAMLLTDLAGKLLTLPYANPENSVNGSNAAAITDTTSTSIIAAQGAGVRAYVTDLVISNSHATVGTVVKITDGSGGTVLFQCYCAPAGGGVSHRFAVPIKTTANTALHAVCVTTGSSVYVTANGYKGA